MIQIFPVPVLAVAADDLDWIAVQVTEQVAKQVARQVARQDYYAAESEPFFADDSDFPVSADSAAGDFDFPAAVAAFDLAVYSAADSADGSVAGDFDFPAVADVADSAAAVFVLPLLQEHYLLLVPVVRLLSSRLMVFSFSS